MWGAPVASTSEVAPPSSASSIQVATLWRAWWLMRGPTKVVGSRGSPTILPALALASSLMKRLCTDRSTMTRCTEMQDWAGESEPARRHRPGGRTQVGIGAHYDRGRVAQFETDPLLRRPGRYLPSDLAGAGKGVHPHTLVVDEHVTDLRGGAHDHGQRFHRQAGFVQDVGERGGRQRRISRGLQHHPASGGDGGADLVGGQVQGEVERCDRGDHADRNPDGETAVTHTGGMGVECHAGSGQGPGLGSREVEGLNAAVDLDHCLADRLPYLERQYPGEGIPVRLDPRCGTVEDLGAAIGRERVASGAMGCVYGIRGLRPASGRHHPHQRSVPRRTHFQRVP